MKTLLGLGLLWVSLSLNSAAEELWVARPFTQEKSFTKGIEGPACDAQGNVYAVNFEREGTIGKVAPDGTIEVAFVLPAGSVGNGIRIDTAGFLVVADYKGHNLLRVDPATKQVSVLAHEPTMSQPNDLTRTPSGDFYASDPNWKAKTGRIWRVTSEGKITLSAQDLGTVNGIEASPDGRTLYINETMQRKVWAFDIGKDGALSNKRLVKAFEDFGFDGMRCDADGNLYITRHGKGTVIKMTPAGEILHEVDVLGMSPTNLCFGGPDGRTVYVTEVDHQRLVSFRVDKPGREWGR